MHDATGQPPRPGRAVAARPAEARHAAAVAGQPRPDRAGPAPAAAPAVVVHAAAQAAAALAAAGPHRLVVVLLSAPGAGGGLGAAVFLRLIARAAAAHPGVAHRAVLDCADAPGHALAALRAGVPAILLDPACPALPAVEAAAAACGAAVLTARPRALDLGRVDLRRVGGRALLAAWLAGAEPG